MNQKLSVLIFSRNEAEKAVALAKYTYGIADEIILVDSSDVKNSAILAKMKKDQHLSKIRIYYAVAFGYPDPFRMYALSKCKYDWVLLIDTDERLSEPLLKDIKNIVGSTKHSGFTIKRYEEVRDGRLPKLFTWQTRLFRRSRTTFKGNLHEQPMISGGIGRLDGPYYMTHNLELMQHTRRQNREYREMRRFDRFTYRQYNEKIAEGASRMSMQKDGLHTKALKAYQGITLRNQEREVSLFDYWAYYFSVELLFGWRNKDVVDIIGALPKSLGYAKQYNAWLRSPDSKEEFAIAQIINKIGIIRFLGLDKDSVVRAINRKYRNKEQGVKLLIELLKRKYEGKPL